MKKISLIVSEFCFLAVALGGCATILNEDYQMVNVSSSNGLAFKGTVDGIPFQGPGAVPIKRAKGSRILAVETNGCTKQTALNSDLDYKFFINAIFIYSFPLWSTTDYATEKMWKYQDNVTVSCK